MRVGDGGADAGDHFVVAADGAAVDKTFLRIERDKLPIFEERNGSLCVCHEGNIECFCNRKGNSL